MTRDEVRAAIGSSARDGVVLARDLRLLGVTSKEVLLARKAEALVRQLPGIYLLGGQLLDDATRAAVARAYCGEGSVVTGVFAAHQHGMRWLPAWQQVQVLVGAETRRTSTGWLLVRRCGHLQDIQPVRRNGIWVAPAAQTVVDAGRELSCLREVRGLVLGAVADKTCTPGELVLLLDAGAVAGTALVRRACADAERGAVSPPEAEVVDALLELGIPFYVNVEVWLNGVFLGVADIWLVGRGVGGEVDSEERHGTPDLLDMTLERDGRFRRADLSLEHVTPRRFRQDPGAFVQRLVAEADRRERLRLREPDVLELRPRGPLLS